MPTIIFKTKLIEINSWIILHLPEDASAQLPSRGMTMVSGTLNGVPFQTVLEPDGHYMSSNKPSHWFQPKSELLKKAGVKVGKEVSVTLDAIKEWIEPDIPDDVTQALASSPKAQELWNDLTPLAHWDWIRWIRAVKTPETRQKHIDVMLNKLNKRTRRPCCFNRALCSVPEVSHNWVLNKS